MLPRAARSHRCHGVIFVLFSAALITSLSPLLSGKEAVAQKPTVCKDDGKDRRYGWNGLRKRTIKELHQKYIRHYENVGRDLRQKVALRQLTVGENNFSQRGTTRTAMVHRFVEKQIPVYVYSEKNDEIILARWAIGRLNTFIGKFGVELVGREKAFLRDYDTAGANNGIHVYFGSLDCMWKVFREQAGVDRRDLVKSDSFQMRQLRGITMRQSKIANGKLSGEIYRSLVVVLYAGDPSSNRHTILHELIHALGVQAHTGPLLWSAMSIEANVAPLQDLTRYDREVLRILYTELEPGDPPERAAAALRRAWRPHMPRSRYSRDKCIENLVTRQTTGAPVQNQALLDGLFCR